MLNYLEDSSKGDKVHKIGEIVDDGFFTSPRKWSVTT